MKTRRKMRTRRLALDFATPPSPLPEDRVRQGFARLKEAVSTICRPQQNCMKICVDKQREFPMMQEA